MKKLLCLIACFCAIFFISACNDEPLPPSTTSVTLELDGGKIDGGLSYTATIGKDLLLNTPTKHGHTFLGWSYNGEIIDITPFSIEEYAIILKAEWSENPCVITLDAYGGTLSGNSQITVDKGEEINVSNPTRVGYDFVGWTFNESSVNLETFDVNGLYDIVFRAKWQRRNYALTIDFNGGFVNENGVDVYEKSLAVGFNEGLNLPIPSKKGYVFNGYTVNGEPLNSVWNFDVDGAVVLAEYKPVSVYFELDSNGAEVVLPEACVINYGASTKPIKDIIPTKTGYDFKGWYVDGEPLGNEFLYLPSLAKVIVTAKFEAKKYVVTLNAGDGSVSGNPSYSVTFNEEVYFEVPTAPSGKSFVGWKKGDKFVSSPSGYSLYSFDYSGELTAEYSTDNYLVFINYDGSINKIKISQTGEYGEDEIPEPLSKRGYYFTEWTWDGKRDGDLIEELTETTEIRATYSPMETYVTFDSGVNDYKTYLTFGEVYNFPVESVNGKEFLGWSLSKNDRVNLLLGDCVWDVVSRTATVYAIHVPKTYTITYDTSEITIEHYLTSNGERVSNYQTVTYGEEYNLYFPVVKDNLLTVKWYYNGKEISNSGEYLYNKDITVKAKVEINSVEVPINIDLNGGMGRPDVTITLNGKISAMSSLPTPLAGCTLKGFTYKGKLYLLTDVWKVIDYDGSPLIAQYEGEPLIVRLKIDWNGGTGPSLVKITVGQRLNSVISSTANAPQGYKLIGFNYRNNFYSLEDIWTINYDYQTDESLVAVYESDEDDWV